MSWEHMAAGRPTLADERSGAGGLARGDQPTLLIVDDEENVVRSLRRLFRGEDAQIRVATDPADALALLAEEPVTVVISDQRMPGMNGIEFLQRVKERSPATMRIMLTGFLDVGAAEQAVNSAEVYRFFLKPWNDDDLRITVRSAIRQYRLREENERLQAETMAQKQALEDVNRDLERKVDERSKKLLEYERRMLHESKMAAIGTLAGGVAHELNNPLSGILAFSQILLTEHRSSPQLTEDLTQIEQCAVKCKRIVDSLLRFARRSEEDDARAPVDVHNLVRKAIAVGRMQKGFRAVQLEEALDAERSACLVDGDQLVQVFVNLIINATQAILATERAGALRVSSRVVPGPADGPDLLPDLLEVCVADNGCGMTPETRSRIFEPFFTTKAPGEGTGLGLAIVHNILQAHGGSIHVDSEPGQGSELTVRLPLAPEGAGDGEAGY
jgi:signal transduction histidine kinase